MVTKGVWAFSRAVAKILGPLHGWHLRATRQVDNTCLSELGQERSRGEVDYKDGQRCLLGDYHSLEDKR